ncbi:MAG: hypothetical protein AB1295_04635 [Candidatus Micrarchaeota archaeon]
MNLKLMLLVVLAASFLMLGCAGKAKTSDTGQAAGEVNAPADSPGQDEDAAGVDAVQDGSSDAVDPSELADLFQIDTDKPLSDEGLDVSTPSSGQG